MRHPRATPCVVLAVLAAALVGACRGGPKRTCKVNDQCFVCPDEAAVTRCKADPTRSRCKWTPLEDCK